MSLGPEFSPQFHSPLDEFVIRTDEVIDGWLDQQTEQIDNSYDRELRRIELKELFMSLDPQSLMHYPELRDLHRRILTLSVSIFGLEGFGDMVEKGRQLNHPDVNE